ncbi:MAG: VOC family protein [Deltaproteobacteria bacterium]|nr:VOC family protein [Deltaproteobacteria bacterium]
MGLPVKDMKTSLRFYRDLLGLKVEKDFSERGEFIDAIIGINDLDLWMVKLTAPDGWMLELLEYKSHPGEPRRNPSIKDVGHAHLALTVDSIEEEYKRLKDAGVRFISSPQVSPDGYAKVAFCQDPEGNYVELVEVL